MKKAVLNQNILKKYREHLYDEERSQATIEKYMRDVTYFYQYLPDEDKVITKEVLVAYKSSLSDRYKISSINSMLAALNGLLEFMKLNNLKVKLHKVQRSAFYDEEKELTKSEYKRLLDTAMNNGNERLYMLLQTICGTGIRVSEHRYITVESLKEGKAVVKNKGKVRVIFIPAALNKMLKDYCGKENIRSGSIFITKSGKPMDRSNIWNAMKKLCMDAKVSDKKVFPHNLRHLFALTYYRLQKDVVRLADILGHASIETTRTYTMTTGRECQKSLSKMNLVIPEYKKTT
ncbi:integrase [Clostridium sp. AF15-17LB]|nr:integrase [Clostridium sp. AF15-17LB]